MDAARLVGYLLVKLHHEGPPEGHAIMVRVYRRLLGLDTQLEIVGESRY